MEADWLIKIAGLSMAVRALGFPPLDVNVPAAGFHARRAGDVLRRKLVDLGMQFLANLALHCWPLPESAKIHP
jgi:hypothetical protein